MVGFTCGMASIACWIVAQIPQLVQNYRTKKAEALSPWFLAQWLMVRMMLCMVPMQSTSLWGLNAVHSSCVACVACVASQAAFLAGRYNQLDWMSSLWGAAAYHHLYSNVRISPDQLICL